MSKFSILSTTCSSSTALTSPGIVRRIVTIRGQIEVVKDSLVHFAVPKERFGDESIRISARTLVEKL